MTLSTASRRGSGSAELRLVLLGWPRSGKTTTGNGILGKEAFQESVTTKSSVQTSHIGGRSMSLIDTPQCLMVSCPSDKRSSREELEKCLKMAAPGAHTFLLVRPLGKPPTREDTEAVEWIRQRLGEEALQMTVVLFTRREKVTKREFDRFLSQQEVQGLIRRCGGGYHTVNSKAEIEPNQVTELLERVDALVERNGGKHYATDKFLQARTKVDVEEEKVGAVEERGERNWGELRREMEMKRQKREEERRKEKEERRKEEEERKKREEDRKKKELLELEEREKRRQRQERERVERERRRLEEEEKNRQQQERRRQEEEAQRQQEAGERLEAGRRQQEEVARRLEEERGRQEAETRRLVEGRRQLEVEQLRQELERLRLERSRQGQGGAGQGQGQGQGGVGQEAWWRAAERCAAVAGSFVAPFFRR